MKTQFVLVALAAASMGLAGCSLLPYPEAMSSTSTPVGAGRPAGDTGIGELVYLGAQTMVDRAGILAKDKTILVATMVSVDDLSSSSTFGRLSSQLIANRLSQRGYQVRDVSYMGALAVAPYTGELVLSRDASTVSRSLNAQAVVAGTYAIGGKEIFLNMRLLRASDGMILSSADVVLPLDKNIEAMIGDDRPQGQPAQYVPPAPPSPRDGERGERG